MDNSRKLLAIAGAIGILGIALILKSAGHRHRSGIGSKTVEGLEEAVRESIKGLNKAASQIQNVFEHLTINKI